MFAPRNVETSFEVAHELADFSGLSPFDIVVFRPQRLIIHGLLIRVTTTLSVPDGPDYEELGINLRSMVRRIFEGYVEPEMDALTGLYETIREQARAIIKEQLAQLRHSPKQPPPPPSGLFQRLGALFSEPKSGPSLSLDQRIAQLQNHLAVQDESLELVCGQSLLTVVNSIIGHRGNLVGDDDTIVQLATGMVLNDWASLRLGEAVTPLFEKGAQQEGYRILPSQDKPFIMNVKGASASGKSTIRPKQRQLAERLGIAWEDFALVSPDYWRKYLLEYETLGEHKKYGAMLTGHELAIIDRKLDRQMARRAEAGNIPHLLIDRFRFDSFNFGDDQSSVLLTRFGDTVFMFFMITPPEATVERAYQRGLTTGRYKAVDDLLDHNIEAYTGMPALFFSWASSSKRVHYEFLDNSVPHGESPRTVAYGWNGELNILDVSKLLDIDRFTKIDVDAQSPDQIYLDGAQDATLNTAFLEQCAESVPKIRFADQKTGRIFGVLEQGTWVWRDTENVDLEQVHADTKAGLEALGWSEGSSDETQPVELFLNAESSDLKTLGEWG